MIELLHPNVALRTLGIPARPITNFKSAHEVHANRAIDYYRDAKGNPMNTSDDSIWLVNALLDALYIYICCVIVSRLHVCKGSFSN